MGYTGEISMPDPTTEALKKSNRLTGMSDQDVFRAKSLLESNATASDFDLSGLTLKDVMAEYEARQKRQGQIAQRMDQPGRQQTVLTERTPATLGNPLL
jgi:hypothetical protein